MIVSAGLGRNVLTAHGQVIPCAGLGRGAGIRNVGGQSQGRGRKLKHNDGHWVVPFDAREAAALASRLMIDEESIEKPRENSNLDKPARKVSINDIIGLANKYDELAQVEMLRSRAQYVHLMELFDRLSLKQDDEDVELLLMAMH